MKPHMHHCRGSVPGDFGRKTIDSARHDPHLWICYRPVCEDPEELICGLYADVLARYNDPKLKLNFKYREDKRYQ